jgi:Protein of unknown function (DUF4239)
MLRWLLNTFSTWALVPIVIGPPVLFAAGGLYCVRRRWAHVPGEQSEATGVLIGLVAAVYGIVLAFVIVVLYEDYRGAGSSVRDEATEIEQLVRDTRAFPPAVGREIAGRLDAYTRTVVGPEWELMRDGRFSPLAWREIDGLYAALQRYRPRTDTEDAFYGEAVTTLNDLVAARRERLRFAEETLPGAFQALIFGGAVVLIGFTFLIGMAPGPLQMTMVVAVAGLVGLNLLLVVLLDHPFSGDVSVTPHAFSERFTER